MKRETRRKCPNSSGPGVASSKCWQSKISREDRVTVDWASIPTYGELALWHNEVPEFRLVRFLSGLVLPLLFGVLSTYTKKVENISKNNFKKITKTLVFCTCLSGDFEIKKEQTTPWSSFPWSSCVVHPDVYWQETIWVFSFLYTHMRCCPGEELDLQWNNARAPF